MQFPYMFQGWLRAAAIAAIFLLSGCMTQTQATSTWLEGSADRVAYERLLVIALTQEGDKRISFEEQLAQEITTGRTRAWASSQLMDTTLPVNEETVSPVAREINADAVIVTLVANMQVTTVDSEPYTDVMARRKPGTVFQYDYIEKQAPSVINTEFSVSLTTDVIDANSRAIVYRLSTATQGHTSMSDVIDAQTRAVARKLKRDGIAR